VAPSIQSRASGTQSCGSPRELSRTQPQWQLSMFVEFISFDVSDQVDTVTGVGENGVLVPGLNFQKGLEK